ERSFCHPERSFCHPERSFCHPERSFCHPERSFCHPEYPTGPARWGTQDDKKSRCVQDDKRCAQDGQSNCSFTGSGSCFFFVIDDDLPSKGTKVAVHIGSFYDISVSGGLVAGEKGYGGLAF